MTEKTNAKTMSRPARPAPRRAATGDVAPKETAAAIEQFVMRRLTAFRVDYGETAYTLYKEAFSKRTMTV